jgi:hypothetical protein
VSATIPGSFRYVLKEGHNVSGQGANRGDGQHPSEAVVAVTTADGKQEQLIVDERSLEGRGSLRVGYPLRTDRDRYLIELPGETMRGSWRIWVNKEILEPEEEAA